MQAQIYERIFVIARAQDFVIPQAVLQAAVAANPWFTQEGILLAFNQLKDWFSPEALSRFVAAYLPLPDMQTGWAGIITAGNIPFVGMHDVLMAFLSGRQVQVKCARQDALLLPWFWQTLLQGTDFEGQVQFAESLTPPGPHSLVMATGGDHTARQLAWAFRGHHLLMRNNRFSAAVIAPAQMTASHWAALCDDLLLYNGLGCRNVSNILLVGGEASPLVPDPLIQALARWHSPTLSAAYQLSRAYDQAKTAIFPERTGLETRWLRFVAASHIQPMPLGEVALIGVQSQEAARHLLDAAQDQLQVVVGNMPAFSPLGTAQQPGLEVFADGIDTFAACLQG